MNLTVACVWVDGHVPFTSAYVTKLEAMARRHIDRPFRFVCLTDRPHKVAHGIETLRVHYDQAIKGWWAKLALFDVRNGFEGRVLYLDLDTLIVNALDEIIDYPAPFALATHAGTFEGKNGLAVVKRFNSSVMVWDAGSQRHLYDRFLPDVPRRLWGDQDWIGEQSPNAAAMPIAWFPRLSELDGERPDTHAKVVLAKRPKNVIAAQRWKWFAEAWV